MNKMKIASYNTVKDVSMDQAFVRGNIGSSGTNSRVYARDISSGVLRGEQSLSDGNVRLDSSNRRILIYDEDGNCRVLIGYDESGF